MRGGGGSGRTCPNKNTVSRAAGGPYTPRFEQMFKKAGMLKGLENPLNRIPVLGHGGPHPEANRYVYEALQKATAGLGGQAYGSALRQRLAELAKESQTPGLDLRTFSAARRRLMRRRPGSRVGA
ncbi:MAG: AHH domain-containing protein [Deltaproteobacteria bacterium]|nr:AHH domain-containing protein [Deltaproteobacteria bacterium]